MIRIVNLGTNRLAELVRQNERGPILNAEIAAYLRRRVFLGPVNKNGDCRKVIANR